MLSDIILFDNKLIPFLTKTIIPYPPEIDRFPAF